MIQPTTKHERQMKSLINQEKRIQERKMINKNRKKKKLKHNTRIKRIPKFYELFNYHYLVFVFLVVGWDLFVVWIIEMKIVLVVCELEVDFYYYCSMLKKLIFIIYCSILNKLVSFFLLFTLFSFLTTIFTFFRIFEGDNLKLIELGDKVRLTSIKVDFLGDSWELNYSNQLLTNLLEKEKWKIWKNEIFIIWKIISISNNL